MAWHLCSTPSARHTPPTHLPHALHVPTTHHPQANHSPSHTSRTNHTPSTCCHIPSTRLPHAIHMPSVYHLRALFTSSTHKLQAISKPPITCHVLSIHTHTLSIPSQMSTRHQVGTPGTVQPGAPDHLKTVKTHPLPHPPGPKHLLTFAGAALPGDDLSTDPTGFHLLEGLHFEVVSLGGLQILWLWEEKHSSQARAEGRAPRERTRGPREIRASTAGKEKPEPLPL